MVSIGDLKNNLKILQSEAKQMRYHEDFDLEGLAKGNPQSLLPLYNHLFTSYNPAFTEEVMNVVGDVLSTKSDVRFIESIYKILRDMLNFKPSMTKEQFFTLNNFAERKIIMCIEIMRTVRERCRFIGPKNPTNPHIKVNSVVDTGLHPKKPSIEIQSESNSNSDTLMQRRLSEKVCRPAHSLMGMSEKDSWHMKLGYLRPKSPEEHLEGSRKDCETRKRSLSRDQDQECYHHSPVSKMDSREKALPLSPTLHKKSKQTKMSEMGTGSPDPVPNDWDPSEAVECILSKVRDLPSQLTSFMKAVETRLLKIEDRLDYVEAVVSGINHAEGKAAVNDIKREVELLQARLTLLENRVTLAESKANNPVILETHKQHHQYDDKRSDYSSAAFAALERGAASTLQQIQYFSPIHPSVLATPNDTITSVADADDRRSSTPNHSAFGLYNSSKTGLNSNRAAVDNRMTITTTSAAESKPSSSAVDYNKDRPATVNLTKSITDYYTDPLTEVLTVDNIGVSDLAASVAEMKIGRGTAVVDMGSRAVGYGRVEGSESVVGNVRPMQGTNSTGNKGRVINVAVDIDRFPNPEVADISTVFSKGREQIPYDGSLYSERDEDHPTSDLSRNSNSAFTFTPINPASGGFSTAFNMNTVRTASAFDSRDTSLASIHSNKSAKDKKAKYDSQETNSRSDSKEKLSTKSRPNSGKADSKNRNQSAEANRPPGSSQITKSKTTTTASRTSDRTEQASKKTANKSGTSSKAKAGSKEDITAAIGITTEQTGNEQRGLSTVGAGLDMSTMEQVERIKQMFKATEKLFPTLESPRDSAQT